MWFLKPNVQKLTDRGDLARLVKALTHHDLGIAQAAESAVRMFGEQAGGSLARRLEKLGPLISDRTVPKGILVAPAWDWLDERVVSQKLSEQKILIKLLAEVAPESLLPILQRIGGRTENAAVVDALAFSCLSIHSPKVAKALVTSIEGSQLAEKAASHLAYFYREDRGANENTAAAIGHLCVLHETVAKVLGIVFDYGQRNEPIDKKTDLIRAIAAKNSDALAHYLRYGDHSPIDLELELLATVLRRIGAPWATDGILFVCLSHPMGHSWKKHHDACLAMIQDRSRALHLLLEIFSQHPTIDSAPGLRNVPYCFSQLAGLAWDVRYSDYDTTDLENRSMAEQLRSDVRQQADATRKFFGAMHRAAVDGHFAADTSVTEAARAVLSRDL